MQKVTSLVLLALLCLAAIPALAQTETETPSLDNPLMPESTPESSMVNLNPWNLVGTDAVAFIHFANTVADGPSVDLYVPELDDSPVVADLAFGEATDSILLPAGSYDVVVRAAGSGLEGDVITTMNWNFQPDTSWLLAFVGLVSNVSLQLEPINLLRNDIADTMLRVRVVNFVTDAPALTVSSSAGDDFGKGLGWIGVFDAEMTPGTFELTVTSQDGTVLLTESDIDLGGGMLSTVLLVGSSDGSQPLRLVIFNSLAYVSRVEFVNNSGVELQIFVRPGKVELIPSLAAGETSEWVTIPSGSVTFVAYAPGTGPTGQELGAWIGEVQALRDLTISFTADNAADASDPVFSPAISDITANS